MSMGYDETTAEIALLSCKGILNEAIEAYIILFEEKIVEPGTSRRSSRTANASKSVYEKRIHCTKVIWQTNAKFSVFFPLFKPMWPNVIVVV